MTTISKLERNVREISVAGTVQVIKSLLDTIMALLNEPGPEAAGVRAACVRAVMELMQEIVGVTG